jgi:hypothetical protein
LQNADYTHDRPCFVSHAADGKLQFLGQWHEFLKSIFFSAMAVKPKNGQLVSRQIGTNKMEHLLV